VKCLTPVSVEICGEKAAPDTPIPYVAATPEGILVNNWSAYLKDTSHLVGSLFNAALTPDIFRVWNMTTSPSGNLTPQSFLPLIPAGLNFEMKQGRGYIVNATEDGQFRDSEPYPSLVENGCEFFKTPLASTLKTATLLFPKTLLEDQLSRGDEIGVFDAEDRLYASGKFNGFALSMVITGDEDGTEQREGFLENEQMFFKIWGKASQQIQTVEASFQCGHSNFQSEGIFLATGLNVLQSAAVAEPAALPVWSLRPNPASESVQFSIKLPAPGIFSLDIIRPNGQVAVSLADQKFAEGAVVETAQIGNLAAGIYFVQLKTQKGISVKKLIIAR